MMTKNFPAKVLARRLRADARRGHVIGFPTDMSVFEQELISARAVRTKIKRKDKTK
jgi:hypothetical protein